MSPRGTGIVGCRLPPKLVCVYAFSVECTDTVSAKRQHPHCFHAKSRSHFPGRATKPQGRCASRHSCSPNDTSGEPDEPELSRRSEGGRTKRCAGRPTGRWTCQAPPVRAAPLCGEKAGRRATSLAGQRPRFLLPLILRKTTKSTTTTISSACKTPTLTLLPRQE